MCLALIETRRQKETKKEKNDGRRRERAEDEVDRSFCPSRCQRQIIVLTLSELLRPCAAPVSRLFPGRRDRCHFFNLVLSLSAAWNGLPTNVRPLEQNSEERRKEREGEEGGRGARVWSPVYPFDRCRSNFRGRDHSRPSSTSRDRDKAPVAAYHL